MMAAAAKFRNDISGAITTGGTSVAYTVTSNQVFDTLAHLHQNIIAFVPNATNGGTCTLAVDGLTAKPIRSAPSVEIPSGTLVSGTPYLVSYNNTDGAFYLLDFYASPYIVPIGSFLPYVGTTAPNSAFVLPFGQAISRTTYSTLFGMISTSFGTGDGSTTFNIPDLRGRFLAGKDDMGGSAASRIGSVVTDNGTISGTSLGSTGGSATHVQVQAELPAFKPAITITDPGHLHSVVGTVASLTNTLGAGGINTGIAGTNSTGSNTTGISAALTSNLGSGQAMSILPPSMILNYIMRVV
jgi:microcystin-dependent protein